MSGELAFVSLFAPHLRVRRTGVTKGGQGSGCFGEKEWLSLVRIRESGTSLPGAGLASLGLKEGKWGLAPEDVQAKLFNFVGNTGKQTPGVRLTRRSEAGGGGSGAMGVDPSIAATPPPLPRLATGRCSGRSDLQGAFRQGFVFSGTHPGPGVDSSRRLWPDPHPRAVFSHPLHLQQPLSLALWLI